MKQLPSFLLAILCLATLAPKMAKDNGFVLLFPKEGPVTEGWTVSTWSDVGKPAEKEAKWLVDKEGILHGSTPRGTWLVSKKLYGDFILDFEWKLGEKGNSGCGVRFPDAGDPAFDGLEIQMCDPRYNNPPDTADKLTGSLYMAIAPRKQVYKPTDWNHYTITCQGPKVKVVLNGETIQDINLDEHNKPLKRHGNQPAPPLSQRPRKGHIGFQELSRGGTQVMIRNAKITVLD